ncbi:MAG: amino acid adenylation domain-containing protein [Candidatus Pristimantibacillus sp.]
MSTHFTPSGLIPMDQSFATHGEQENMLSHVLLFTCHMIWLSKVSYDADLSIEITNGSDDIFNFTYIMNETETFKSLYHVVGDFFIERGIHTHTKWLDEAIVHSNEVISCGLEIYSAQITTIMQQITSMQYDVAIQALIIFSDTDREAYTKLNHTEELSHLGHHFITRWRDNLKYFHSNTALVENDSSLTYAEVESLSNKVASMIMHEGIKKGDFVPVFMGRGIDIVISLLGIMKAGAIYVPLDASYPVERNQHILAELNSSLVLTNKKTLLKVQEICEGQSLNIAVYQNAAHYESDFAISSSLSPADVAYVIYTSGSTGKPKGTLVRHEGIVNLAKNNKRIFELTEFSHIGQFVSYNFDPSIADTFSTLLAGARLSFIPEEARMDALAFIHYVRDNEITHMISLPAAFFNQVAQSVTKDVPLGPLQYIGVGGEALQVKSVVSLQSQLGTSVTILNLYGPTECTVTSTVHVIDYLVEPRTKSLPIGIPLKNFSLFILDDKGNLCAKGMPGELHICSVGLALGYFNDEAKTKSSFVDFQHEGKNHLIYKTGDMVRLLADGNIEYISRKDWQVKIRGHRIEIGEIENALLSHPNIKGVYILPKEREDGDKFLAAFYMTYNGEPETNQVIQQYLKERLPSYMVPSYSQHLHSFPTAPTGKIDRKALDHMNLTKANDEQGDWQPTTKTEIAVVESWKKTLSVTHITLSSHFFDDLGGHSLKIMQSLIHLKPDYPFLGIADFFTYQTVSDMVAYLDKGATHTPVKQENQPKLEPMGLPEYPSRISKQLFHGRYLQQNILLTGATGFLGSHLLKDLLETTSSNVFCIMRNADIEKLKGIATGYFGESILAAFDRVTVLNGDLSLPSLGLNESDIALLHVNIDSIIHCAANVNHFGNSKDFLDVNVESTKFLLNLAKKNENTRFHYISTMGILESLSLAGKDLAAYQAIAEFDEIEHDIYTGSKLQSEKLVEEACSQGLAATIYRMGNLVGNSDSGDFQRNIANNAFYRNMKASILLGKAPDVQWYVDLTPINYASEAVIQLAMDTSTAGEVFHICNPIPIMYDQFISIINAYGYEIDMMELDQYEAWLLDPAIEKSDEGMELIISHFDGDGARNSRYYFECQKTVDRLDSIVMAAEPTEEYISKLLDHAVDVGFIPSVK